MKLSWDESFMASAFLSSFRSHDKESKVGAVIVNSEKKEIARGYNGFCSGISDIDLDRTRPGKYKHMVHAETNAVSNLTLKPEKAKIYVTRMPCLNCAKLLWQNNIREWYVPKDCIDIKELAKVKNYNDEENQLLQILLRNGLKIIYVDFGIEDLMDLVEDNKQFFSYLN